MTRRNSVPRATRLAAGLACALRTGLLAGPASQFSLSPQKPLLSLHPALYLSNATPHKGYGDAVLTWSVQAWK